MAIAAQRYPSDRRTRNGRTPIRHLTLVALLLLLLAACSNKSSTDHRGGQPGGASPQQKASPSVNNEPGKALPPPELPSTADKSVPLAKYKLNLPDKDYVAIFFGLGGQRSDPHEDLRLLVPSYAQEPDAFKKQEIADREQPNVDRFIKEHQTADYRYVGYVRSFPIEVDPRGSPEAMMKATRRSEASVLSRVLQPYDFAKKGFPIDPNFCSLRYTTHSSILLMLRHAGEPCFLPVADLDVAKKLEAVRARNAFVGSGTVRQTAYVYIEGLKNHGFDVTTMANVLQFFSEDAEDYVKNADAKPIYEATL